MKVKRAFPNLLQIVLDYIYECFEEESAHLHAKETPDPNWLSWRNINQSRLIIREEFFFSQSAHSNLNVESPFALLNLLRSFMKLLRLSR